eukprot:gene6072-7564_t
MISEQQDYLERNKSLFPQNITIEDCREAIKGVSGFRETVRGDIICFNYDYCFRDTFPDPLKESDPKLSFLYKVRRECRGILFNKKTGKLVCRKFHKFFNINEQDETQQDKIDLSSESFILMEKLDGSLIAPIYMEDEEEKVAWGSKSGQTDLATKIETYIKKNPQHRFNDFSEHWMRADYTPMFEWCSDAQQIVLYYHTECLSLTAIRNMSTGEYISYQEMFDSAKEFNIPIVNIIDPKKDPNFINCKSAGEMLEKVVKMEGLEGYILRFESGRVYKMKSEWYFNLGHTQNTIDMTHEKNIWTLVLGGQLDDAIAKIASQGPVPPRYFKVQSFAKTLFERIDQVATNVIRTIIKCKVDGKQRKHITNDRSIDLAIKKFVFMYYDNIEEHHTVEQHISKVSKSIVEAIQSFCGSSSKLEQGRAI